MTLLGFPVYDCSNESDVEQKFLYPLLTHLQFLGIAPKDILTKRSLPGIFVRHKVIVSKGLCSRLPYLLLWVPRLSHRSQIPDHYFNGRYLRS
jgi:hypothetical protein